MCHYLCE